MKRVTIKDIAEHAKVSRGTVDRVLHNRGKVAKEVVDKINDAVELLGYKPNMMARTLAQNNVYSVAVLIPDPNEDAFWKLPQKGIQNMIPEILDYGVIIDTYYYNVKSPNSFIAQSRKMLENCPDAVLLASEFYNESLELLEQLDKQNLPVILINTLLKPGSKWSYIGQNSFQAGHIAGKLFEISLGKVYKEIIVLNLGPKSSNAIHLQNKESGIRDYFKESDDTHIYAYEFVDFDNKDLLRVFVRDILNSHPQLSGIFVTNSRSRYVASIIKEFNRAENICLLGFDLLEDNVKYLIDGTIDFLLNQNPQRQAELAIKYLVDRVVLSKTAQTVTYVPLDIVIKENVSFYLHDFEVE